MPYVPHNQNKSFWHECPWDCTVGELFLYGRLEIRLDVWTGLVTLGISAKTQTIFIDLNRGCCSDTSSSEDNLFGNHIS